MSRRAGADLRLQVSWRASKAMIASAIEVNARPSPVRALRVGVRWYRPMIMSWVGHGHGATVAPA